MAAANLDYSLSNAFRSRERFTLPPIKNSNPPRLDFTISAPTNFQFQPVFQRAMFKADRNIGTELPLVGPIALGSTNVTRVFIGVTKRISSIFNRTFGIENSPALDALGLTNVFGLPVGILNGQKGYKDLRVAEENSDVTGVALGRLKIAKACITALKGALRIPSVVITLAAQSASKLADALRGIGGICSNAGSVLSGIGLGIQINELWRFRSSLDAVLNDPNLSEELRPEKALEFLKQEIASPENKAFIRRVTSDKCIKMIQEKGPSEANSVLDAIESELRMKIFSSVLAVLGLSLTVASFVITASPFVLSVMEAASLLLSMTWLVLNGNRLLNTLKDGLLGQFDKEWVLLSAALGVAAVSLVFFFSSGIAPLITAATVGAVWLAISAICYCRLEQLENRTCTES